MKGDFSDIHLREVLVALGTTWVVGILRLLLAIRRGRKFRWFDAILDPGLAVLGGMTVWAILEVTSTPDVLQAALTSLGAWGGSRTLHRLEQKYLGGSRAED